MNSAILSALKAHAMPMTFHDYMKTVLYAPGCGYYSNAEPKIGQAGDFITAPELSPVFAECFANQFAPVLSDLSNPMIMELGAGTGKFALDVLTALESQHQLPEKYLILEVSGGLKAQQQNLFQEKGERFLNRVEWISALPASSIEGVIFGNEVLDAMPVHRFIKAADGIVEQGVVLENDQLSFVNIPANEHLIKYVQDIESEYGEFEAGYLSEINLAIKPWLKSLSSCLKKGIITMVDYGYDAKTYYHPTRSSGTVQCYFKHQLIDDPLQNPGEQDITAHVNFTHVAESAVESGLNLIGYTTQMYALMDLGIEEALQSHDSAHSQALRRLMMPAGMGEMFKVITLGKNFENPVRGFSVKGLSIFL